MGILKHFDFWRGVKLLDQEAEAGERELESDLVPLTSSEGISCGEIYFSHRTKSPVLLSDAPAYRAPRCWLG